MERSFSKGLNMEEMILDFDAKTLSDMRLSEFDKKKDW